MDKLRARILYVDQFTEQHYRNTSIFSTPNSINDAFAYYKPCKRDVELEKEDGCIVYEDFMFRKLSDFDDERLIIHSETLNTLYKRMNNSEKAMRCLKKNLRTIHEETKSLEVAYRTLDLFFNNASKELPVSLSLMNVDKEDLTLFYSYYTEAIRDVLTGRWENTILGFYAILVIPGYLGNAKTVRMWAQIASCHRTFLVTDFKDCSDYDSLINELYNANLQEEGKIMSNVVMTCNYVAVFLGNSVVGENRNLYVPASAVLAGRISNICRFDMKGIQFCRHVRDARCKFSPIEINRLVGLGLVPVKKLGEDFRFASCRTLYNGEIEQEKEYPLNIVLSLIENAIRNALLLFNMQVEENRKNGQSTHDFQNQVHHFSSLISEFLHKISKQESRSKSSVERYRLLGGQFPDVGQWEVSFEICIFGKEMLLTISPFGITEKFYAYVRELKLLDFRKYG